jgi:hypothetical protein
MCIGNDNSGLLAANGSVVILQDYCSIDMNGNYGIYASGMSFIGCWGNNYCVGNGQFDAVAGNNAEVALSAVSINTFSPPLNVIGNFNGLIRA